MTIEPLGESAYILRDLKIPAWKVAQNLNNLLIDGLYEAVPAYETVAVFCDFSKFYVQNLSLFDLDGFESEPKLHQIPVCYQLGEDLPDVASQLGLGEDEVIAAHSSQIYECAALGFCPGFPYLRELPPSISGISRRPSPRIRVPVGSVGITGTQTGIYPLERPGGWALIGQTPLIIVDVEDDYFPIRAGDRVEFVPITEVDFKNMRGDRL